jgi:hypothetical protein
LWEIHRAREVVDFVRQTRRSINNNVGKFFNEKYYNYVAFKDKHSEDKIKKLLEQARTNKV